MLARTIFRTVVSLYSWPLPAIANGVRRLLQRSERISSSYFWRRKNTLAASINPGQNLLDYLPFYVQFLKYSLPIPSPNAMLDESATCAFHTSNIVWGDGDKSLVWLEERFLSLKIRMMLEAWQSAIVSHVIYARVVALKAFLFDASVNLKNDMKKREKEEEVITCIGDLMLKRVSG